MTDEDRLKRITEGLTRMTESAGVFAAMYREISTGVKLKEGSPEHEAVLSSLVESYWSHAETGAEWKVRTGVATLHVASENMNDRIIAVSYGTGHAISKSIMRVLRRTLSYGRPRNDAPSNAPSDAPCNAPCNAPSDAPSYGASDAPSDG
jgi:hypothetical protein